MKIKVSKIDPNIGETLEGTLEAAEVDTLIESFEEHHAVGPFAYRLMLSRSGSRVLLKGQIQGEVEGRCRRCLVPVRYGLDIEGTGSFTPPQATTYEEELELSAGELDEAHYVDDELDLAPWIGETVVLELAPYVLCRDECAGLCPHCGGNRNENPCDCAAQVIDPRWEGLLALKRK